MAGMRHSPGSSAAEGSRRLAIRVVRQRVCRLGASIACKSSIAFRQVGAGLLLIALAMHLVFATGTHGQTQEDPIPPAEAEEAPAVPEEVEVIPMAEDSEIAVRLTRILRATEWFEQPDVTVDEGVVFLRGTAKNEQHKEWAGRLAGNTRDVVAVVNRIDVVEKSMWDLSPAWAELKELAALGYCSSSLHGLCRNGRFMARGDCFGGDSKVTCWAMWQLEPWQCPYSYLACI